MVYVEQHKITQATRHSRKKKSNRHIDRRNRIQNSDPQIHGEGILIGKGNCLFLINST